MPAIARAALGMELRVGNGASPEVFNAVSLVANITGPGMKKDTIDVTTHGNITRYKNFIGSLKEGGDVKFDLFFDPTDATQNNSAGSGSTSPGLIYLFETNVDANFLLAFPIFAPAVARSKAWAFAGLITGFDNKYDVTGALHASCTIKIDGLSSVVAIAG